MHARRRAPRSCSACTRRPARRPGNRARLRGLPRVFGMRPQWAEIEGLDNKVAAADPDHDAARGQPARGARRALAAAQPPPPARHRGDGGLLRPRRDRALRRDPAPARAFRPTSSRWRGGLRAARGRRAVELAVRIAGLSTMFSTFDIVEVAAETGLDVKPVARAVLPARQPAPAALAARSDPGAAPRRPLAGAGPGGLARGPLQLHRELAAEVLRGRRPGHRRPRGRLDSRQPGGGALARDAGGHPRRSRVRLTTLPVAVREVRNLIQVPAPMPSVDVPPPAA